MTLSLKKEDSRFLSSPCHLSTTHPSTRRRIMCSTNWNVQPKSTLNSDLCEKNIEDWACRYFMLTKTIQLWDVKLVFTQDDMVNLKKKLQQMDIFDHCTRERAITKWRFLNLQMLQILLCYSLIYTWVVKILYYLNPFWKITMRFDFFSREIRDNLTLTISACFEHLLYICTATICWKWKLQTFSTFFSLTARKKVPQSFKVFIRTAFRKLKARGSSQFFFMILISLTGNSLVNLLVEIFKNIEKVSSSCAGRTGNPKQSSAEIESFWSWDNKQDKAVQNTEQQNQRHIRVETLMEFVDDCTVEFDGQDLSTWFLQMQKIK